MDIFFEAADYQAIKDGIPDCLDMVFCTWDELPTITVELNDEETRVSIRHNGGTAVVHKATDLVEAFFMGVCSVRKEVSHA